MTTKQIADRLVALCRAGKFEDAQKELFAADAMSIEPNAQPGYPKETKGLPAINEKAKKFQASVEKMYALETGDPIVADNCFACTMHLDATFKGQGRMNMTELCVYQVKDGKIISEQFFV